ncbi:MAG TPA: hypothetical protein DCQ06_03280 [Myxococcales bacterium]|nr:hypothetical protein [Myxococcales bacterium]HAN30598.1 hypothetical protein [Myxococcales bacterium]
MRKGINTMRAMHVRLPAMLVALCLVGCVNEEPTAPSGQGVFTLALTGTLPDIATFKLAVYKGALTSTSKQPKFALGCSPYLVGNGETRNAFTLQDMPVGKDYSVLVEYFADDACSARSLLAYRGGIEVKSESVQAAESKPYYLQPVRFGAFTGMATASAEIKAEVESRSCSTDQDCVSVHPAATCSAGSNRCSVDSLFPLNGGVARAFPSLTALADGTIALHGGFSVVDSPTGTWTATSSTVEHFSPALGRFHTPALTVDNFDSRGRVGMSSTAALTGAAYAVVGGQEQIVIGLNKGKLATEMKDATCAQKTTCPVSAAVWRVDTAKSFSSGTELSKPVAFPIVIKVASATGPKVLIAGGSDLPLPKNSGNRRGDAQLCELTTSSAACEASAGKLNAARADAAILCLVDSDDGCKEVLIVGGRASKAAAMVEQYDAQTDAFSTVEAIGAPDLLFGGKLVRAGSAIYLLGASSVALFQENRITDVANVAAPPYRLIVDDSGAERVVRFELAELGEFAGTDGGRRVFGAAVGLTDANQALLIGGVLPNGKVADDALVFGEEGGIDRLPLERARFGAGAVEISSEGPFGGCAFIAGGADISSTLVGSLSHVELYCPK